MTPLQKAHDVFDRCPATKVLIAVSGGKDSLCTLDLAVRRLGAANVVGFLMYLVPDLEVEWAPVRRLERRYGIKVVGVPHYELGRMLKNGIFREDRAQFAKLPSLKQADVENALRKQTGIDWVAWGVRGTDSVQRNAWLKKCTGVDVKGKRLFPLWAWHKRDVYGYLHARKLPVPAITGGGVVSGGVTLTPQCLSWLKSHHPADYAKVLERFPYAGVAVYRHEVLGVDPIAEVKARFRKKNDGEKAVREERSRTGSEG